MFLDFVKSKSYPWVEGKLNIFQNWLNSWIHSDFHGFSTRPSVPKILKEHHILKEPFGATDSLEGEFCINIHRMKTWVVKQRNYVSLW